MKKLKRIVFGVLLLGAYLCLILQIISLIFPKTEEPKRSRTRQMTIQDSINSIQYIQDTRTHLCFAFTTHPRMLGSDEYTLAHVPCTKIPSELLTRVVPQGDTR